MSALATQFSWFGVDDPSVILLIGFLAGWLAGLIFWWHLSDNDRSDEAEVGDLRRRLVATEATLRERTDDVRRLERQLRDSRSGTHDTLRELRRERDEAIGRLDDLQAGLAADPAAADPPSDESNAIIARLEGDLRAARDSAASAESVHAECDARLSRLGAELDEIRGEKDAEIDRLQGLLAGLQAERDAASEEHGAAQAELDAARAAADRNTELERRLAGTRAELDGALARVEALAAERDAAQARADQAAAASGASAELEAQLGTYRRERDEARRDARRQALDMQREFEESTRDAAEEIARLREERKEMQRQLRLAAGEMQRLRRSADQGGEAEAEAERLRARLADVEARHHEELRSRAGQADELQARLDELEARLESLRQPKRKKRPPRDELQRIHGIGPVLEQRLHALGILRFEDIAAWRRTDIVEIAEHLEAFPDRIERDGWVEQARELAKEMRREYGG